MRNICPLKSSYKESTYDMKGSSIEREVLVKNPNALRKKNTLDKKKYFRPKVISKFGNGREL